MKNTNVSATASGRVNKNRFSRADYRVLFTADTDVINNGRSRVRNKNKRDASIFFFGRFFYFFFVEN